VDLDSASSMILHPVVPCKRNKMNTICVVTLFLPILWASQDEIFAETISTLQHPGSEEKEEVVIGCA